jgi:hypothetical protein
MIKYFSLNFIIANLHIVNYKKLLKKYTILTNYKKVYNTAKTHINDLLMNVIL